MTIDDDDEISEQRTEPEPKQYLICPFCNLQIHPQEFYSHEISCCFNPEIIAAE